MIKDIKCLIFDNDGTVADTHDLILASWHYATKEVLGKEFSDEFYSLDVGIPLADQAKRYVEDEAKQEELVRVYREHNARVHDELIRPFAGCKEALRALKAAGYTLAVSTSKMKKVAGPGLEVIGIRDLFDIVVGSEDTKRHKPFGDPILYAAKELGFEPEQCAYIGDSPFDIQAAHDAGVTSVGVTWGRFFSGDRLSKENPNYVCATWGDLVGLFTEAEKPTVGKVIACCISKRKGTQKREVPEITLKEDWGIEEDAHAGEWHRQVSLLGFEKIEAFKAEGAQIHNGSFGENIIVEGFTLTDLPLGTRFKCGEVELELTQIGKECHSHCAIYYQVGKCIMPQNGVFTRVIHGGTIRPGDTIEIIS